MTKHGVSGDCQAEAGPAATNCPSATIYALHGEEAFEDAREVGAVNANAVVNHRDR
jgi:hypothetical protein